MIYFFDPVGLGGKRVDVMSMVRQTVRGRGNVEMQSVTWVD